MSNHPDARVPEDYDTYPNLVKTDITNKNIEKVGYLAVQVQVEWMVQPFTLAAIVWQCHSSTPQGGHGIH
jgi:hypothetical protein